MGGAANVALNVQALGATPYLCAFIGNDSRGDEFIKMLLDLNLSTDGICVSNERITTTKFRVIGNNSQLIRVDEETTNPLSKHEEEMIFATLDTLMSRENKGKKKERINAIIFEDYDKGVITPKLIDRVCKIAKSKQIPVIVDPKKKNFLSYRNISLFKPNIKELKEGLKIDFNTSDITKLTEVLNHLRKKQQIDIVMTTLSEAGIFLNYRQKDKDISSMIKAHVRSVADVSGAGDTVVGTASLCLALGLEPAEIAHISNLAGGLVCEEVGVVPINKEKLLKEVMKMIPK